ncbi:MAG TPA: nicotinate-nucleotide--dimethylbenzimidazole phosphoribosyltransferase [Puia sp.]|nr:nicotinate-nucleotide--dimethylbenzimidazole phosphoribosyltransferase [Puia sp.]
MTTSSISTLEEIIKHKIDFKTKPPGSLGKLEAIALQAGLIQQTTRPQINQPHIVVFAGDHGIAATGLVNPYPRTVTAQMVLNFIQGGAAINVFCRQHQIALRIVDAGVDADFSELAGRKEFIDAKIGYGTRNYLKEPAMTQAEMDQAQEKGRAIVASIHETGCNCIGFGEMGIGNTSAASLMMTAFTGIPLEDCIGRGTGSNDEQLLLKKKTLAAAYQKHAADLVPGASATTILSHVGGFEIAMMSGAFLEAAKRRMIIIVDGFICSVALLAARSQEPGVMDYCIFAHTSGEQGHRALLNWLGVQPLLNLGMRLGEGTGAALAIPLVVSAVSFLDEMASFESAGVSNKD